MIAVTDIGICYNHHLSCRNILSEMSEAFSDQYGRITCTDVDLDSFQDMYPSSGFAVNYRRIPFSITFADVILTGT